jgi:hypothetical protein
MLSLLSSVIYRRMRPPEVIWHVSEFCIHISDSLRVWPRPPNSQPVQPSGRTLDTALAFSASIPASP